MKNLFSTTALALALTFSGAAFAHDASDQTSGPDSSYHDAFGKLPQADQTIMHDSMQKAHDQNKALYDQESKLRDDRKAILSAPKFDKDAFLANSAKMRDLHDKMMTNSATAFASGAAQLPQADRQTLAQTEPHHWSHHGDDKTSGTGTTPGSQN